MSVSIKRIARVRHPCIIGSITYRIDVGLGAKITDLHDNAFTVEGWFKIPSTGALQALCCKSTWGTTGWRLHVNSTGKVGVIVKCVTTNASVNSTVFVDNNAWHFIKFWYDDGDDRKISLIIDGVLDNRSDAGVGVIVSDASDHGMIGNNGFGSPGVHGWIRWSSAIRVTGVLPRWPPPTVDADTAAQWNVKEGNGSTLTDASAHRADGSMAGTYIWPPSNSN